MYNEEVTYKSLESYDDSIIFKLPGSGTSLEFCGEPLYLLHPVSNTKVHFLLRSRSCHRKECPVCWKDWQKRESGQIQERITEYFTGGYTNRRFPVHYVLSPPQSIDYHSKTEYNALKRTAYKIAKQRGIDGGCLIFHERAARYNDDKEYQENHCSQGPHFHIIGDGWLNARIQDFYIDGWIVKNLRSRSLNSVFRTAYYILDHAAIGYPAISHSRNLSMAAVVWFGKMSYNKMKCPKYQGEDVIYCPICKEEISRNDWFIGDWISKKDPPGESGVADQGENGFYVGRSLTGWSGFS